MLAFRGAEQTLRLWQPTADYLSNTVRGYRFVIVPLDHPGMKRALAKQQLDFVLTNTGHYVELEALYGITRIATVVSRHGNIGLNRFGAVIFTRADRKDLKTLRNLHGKVFVAVKPHAFGGFRMAWAELLKHGVDPFTDFKELKFAGFPVDKVAYAVLNREADAGTFRTGVLERLHKAGKIDLKDFKILGRRQTKGFPLLHSTELYPEWPFARTNNAPEKITEKIIIALLKLDQDSPPSRLAGIKGWTVPLDYMKVHELYKTLKVGPYEGLGKISVHALVEQYWHIGIMALLLLIVLTATSLYIWKLDKKVRKSEYCLARAQEIAHIGSWEWEVDRNEMSWSEEVFHILGIEKHDQHISIEDFLERVPEPDAERVRSSLNDTLYRNKAFNIDHKIMLDDGTVRIVHQQAEVRRDESGKVRSMSGIIQDITARKTAEDMIRDSRQELATILDNMQDTFFRIDRYGRIISISPSVQQLLGYTTDEIIGTRFTRYLASPAARGLFYEELRRHDGRVDNFEIELRDKDGLELSAAISAHLFYDDQTGDLIGVEGVARNITELVNAREDLSKEKERIQTTLESIGDGVITTDVTGVVEYMNAVADKITGWQLAEARGMPLFQVFDVKAPRAGKSLDLCLQKTLSDDNDNTCAIHNAVLVSKSGERFFVEITMAPIRDHGSQTIGSVIVFHDITEAREMAKKMAYQARHDALTGLVNRQEFEDQLEHLLHSNPEHKSHAVLIIEINNFAEIEENCGRSGRDDLLRQVANQLRAQVRDVDALARIGGAEFGLLLRNCPQDRAKSIAQALLSIGEGLQYTHEGHIFDIGLNIGVAGFDGSNLTVDDVLNAGELACVKAKSLGNNTLHVSTQDEDIEEQRMRERAWKARIRKALEDDRLTLYYQPVFPVAAQCRDMPAQYEVLVRMQDEQGNIILPLAFMAAAERYRMIREIDEWVFLHVLDVLENDKQLPQDSVFSINVSAHSVHGDRFQELVASRLKRSHVMPERIRFEIRESVALGNYVDTLAFINFLSNIGCQFVLDNFGIGPSSFSYLQNIPVEYVKIDGSLIRNIASSEIDYAIVEALNLVVHSMGKICIAKSVENDATKRCLEKIGVDYMQGFGVEKPLPLFPNDPAMSETA